MKMKMLLLALSICAFSANANAAFCDYQPSKVIGALATGATVAGTGVAGTAGIVGSKAASLYSITHATTGAAMLGSTATGASAAGTTGIIAGSGGVLGAIGSVAIQPWFWIPAIGGAAIVAGLEVGCRFKKD